MSFFKLTTEETKSAFFVGIAIFTMVFGAGNIIFPIVIGNIVGKAVFYAIAGIILSSVLIPAAGFLSCLEKGGNFKAFLEGWFGKILSSILAIAAMLILGPLGCIPRCATLAHAAVSWNLVPGLSLFWFSAAFSTIVFALAYKQDKIINVLGRFLGPINLIFMSILLIKGIFFSSPEFIELAQNPGQAFSTGFFESYKTFDLLAMVFYSSAIVSGISSYLKDKNLDNSHYSVVKVGAAGAVVSSFLFTLIYSGFCYMAAANAAKIQPVGREVMLSAYSTAIFGNNVNLLTGFIILMACISATVALSVVFARYLSDYGQNFGLGYRRALLLTTVLGCGLSNLGFTGIDKAVMPLMKLLYPFLIVVSVLGAFGILISYKAPKMD